MIKSVLKIIVPMFILMFSACAIDIAGNGSEIVNGKLAAGNPDVLVEAVEVGYVESLSPPEEIIQTYTDDNGLFSLILDTSCYNIIIRDTLSGIGAFIPEVRRGDRLGLIELSELGSIEVSVLSINDIEYLVYISGTPFSVLIYGNEISSIDNVPPGFYNATFCITKDFSYIVDPSEPVIIPEPYTVKFELTPSDCFQLHFKD